MRFTDRLQLGTTFTISSRTLAISHTHTAIHYSSNLSLLNHPCLQKSSSNGFQRQTFSSVSVAELSPSRSHDILKLAISQQLYSHSRVNLCTPLKKAVCAQTELLSYKSPRQKTPVLCSSIVSVMIIAVIFQQRLVVLRLLSSRCLAQGINVTMLYMYYLAFACH